MQQPEPAQTLRSSNEPRGLVRDKGVVKGGGETDPGLAAAGALAAARCIPTPGERGKGETGGVENAGSELGEIMGRRLTRMAE